MWGNIGETALPEYTLIAGGRDWILNMASAQAHWRSSINRGMANVWVFGHIVGMSMDR
jgi:hypothetical protein